ncbi:MAG: hypothetical protein ACRC5C_07580 [Bacilli bacterium]
MKAIRKSTPDDFSMIQDVLAQVELPSEQVPGCELQFYLLETQPDRGLCGLVGYQQCGGYGVLRGFVLLGSLTEEEMFQFFDEVVTDVKRTGFDTYMVSVTEAMFPFFNYFGFELIDRSEVAQTVLDDVYIQTALAHPDSKILRKCALQTAQ